MTPHAMDSARYLLGLSCRHRARRGSVLFLYIHKTMPNVTVSTPRRYGDSRQRHVQRESAQIAHVQMTTLHAMEYAGCQCMVSCRRRARRGYLQLPHVHESRPHAVECRHGRPEKSHPRRTRRGSVRVPHGRLSIPHAMESTLRCPGSSCPRHARRGSVRQPSVLSTTLYVMVSRHWPGPSSPHHARRGHVRRPRARKLTQHVTVSILPRSPETLYPVSAPWLGILRFCGNHKQQHNATGFLQVATAFQPVLNPSMDFEGHISISKSRNVASSGQITLSSRPPHFPIRSRPGRGQSNDGQHIQREDIFAGCLG